MKSHTASSCALTHRVAPERSRLEVGVHRRQLADLRVARLGAARVVLHLLPAGLLARALVLVAGLPRRLLARLAAVGHRKTAGAELQVRLGLVAAVALAAAPDAHALLAARDHRLGGHLDGGVHPCAHLRRQALLLRLRAAVGLLGFARDAPLEHVRAGHHVVERLHHVPALQHQPIEKVAAGSLGVLLQLSQRIGVPRRRQAHQAARDHAAVRPALQGVGGRLTCHEELLEGARGQAGHCGHRAEQIELPRVAGAQLHCLAVMLTSSP